ncbi:MAG: amidophosphoribosyltransferase [Phycisphaerae bacterium]
MSDELHHECGVAALYLLDEVPEMAEPEGMASGSPMDGSVSFMMPQILLDLQNRGQLAAGMSTYNRRRVQLLDTFKDVGTVSEVFRMSNPTEHHGIIEKYAGVAAIGHTRYATCGLDDHRYAQPFERHHGRTWKWFAFAFNGNLANYTILRDRLLAKRHYHFTLDTDTEIVMHSLAYRMRGDKPPELKRMVSSMARSFDGAYNLAFLDGMGRMFVCRDPLGFRPMSYAVQGRLFAAASESTALTNLGFKKIHHLRPGEMAIVENGKLRIETFAARRNTARCFFEWVYFSNVASTIDEVSVYLARARSGQRLAELEDQPLDDDCIVVPVPDTAKAAADAFAYALKIPSVEGLIRNRYIGRTFIQPNSTRRASAKSKYTALPEIIRGRRVFLVEDSIVRSTTLKTLVKQIRNHAGAKEIHVRVACPPIVAPCFYGIDMSTLGELFAPNFTQQRYRGNPSEEMMARMAEELKIDSLRYLSTDAISECLGIPREDLCVGCVAGKYPTDQGNRLMRSARRRKGKDDKGRTYE